MRLYAYGTYQKLVDRPEFGFKPFCVYFQSILMIFISLQSFLSSFLRTASCLDVYHCNTNRGRTMENDPLINTPMQRSWRDRGNEQALNFLPDIHGQRIAKANWYVSHKHFGVQPELEALTLTHIRLSI